MALADQRARPVLHGRVEMRGTCGGGLWYNIAHCFILASYKEAFGAVTNEALLAGCWCLISNKAGSQCLVEEGVNGYTFNPMDEDELVEKMEKVRSNMIIDETEKLRPNLMRVDYGERMTNLINTLKA